MATIHCPKCTEESFCGDHIYAILLPPESFPENKARDIGKGWAYVGRTGNRVEDRFDSNFNPNSKCFNKKFLKFGIVKEDARLMHEVHSQFNPVKKEPNDRDSEKFKGNRATYAEYHLCRLLEQAGYCVDSDALTAFKIQPNPKKSQT